MSRQIDHRSTSAHPADEVYATMVAPDFLRARLERIGGPGAGLLEHAADADGAAYRMRHGVDAKNLPAMVKGVLPGNLTIERSERWTRQDHRYLGEINVTIPGAPGSAGGGMRLRGLPDGGSELVVRVGVTVSVPLIGGKIEDLVRGHIRDILAAEAEFTQRWLAGDRR